ncbi:MAG: hypothetical protein ABIQ16_19050 [Polyangiaceae bacterium]
MNDIEREPLDPDLIAALRADFASVPTITKQRVSQCLTASIGAPALSAAHPVSARPSAKAWAGLRAYPGAFIAGIALGSALGAGLALALQKPATPEIRYVSRPISEAIVSAPIAQVSAQSALAPAPKPAAVSTSSAPAANDHRGAAQLADQQALLDVARRAFTRSDYESALQTLAVHERRFPKSVLGEEREALRIKALAARGQLAEAKARAVRFKARFSQSLLLPSLIDSLGAIP